MSDYPPYRVRFPGKKPGRFTNVYAFSWHGLAFELARTFYYAWKYPIDRHDVAAPNAAHEHEARARAKHGPS